MEEFIIVKCIELHISLCTVDGRLCIVHGDFYILLKPDCCNFR